MKICLVVDDSDVVRKVARQILEQQNFIVVEAANGEEAMQHCRNDIPDAILVDWHMPVKSGQEFIEELRREEEGDRPFIIYCTTEADIDDISRAFDAGADEFLLKPFERRDLEAKLASARLA